MKEMKLHAYNSGGLCRGLVTGKPSRSLLFSCQATVASVLVAGREVASLPRGKLVLQVEEGDSELDFRRVEIRAPDGR